jgi:hypothetical protein
MMAIRSALRRSFPTVRYLIAPFRWLAGSRRRVLAAAAVVLAMIAALLLWWSMQLLGLPDIGDPLDGEAFRPPRVPEDRDAFVLYRRAAEGVNRSMRTRYQAWYEMQLLGRWSAALPELRRWAEGTRESLALFREAADRPDSTLLSDGDRAGLWRALRCLRSLALFEASRLEERGDMAGAWTWYRAVMRTIEHQVAYSRFAERKEALPWRDRLRDRLAAWAADPRTTPAMLRRALDDAIACESMSPLDSDSFRAEYLDLERSVDDPRNPARQVTPGKWEAIFGVPERYLGADRMQAIYDLWRFWRRESERSRRVIRLAVANWLACEDLPADRRPQPDPHVFGPYEFYAFGPEAPAGARVLSPEALDRWLTTSPEAAEILDRWQMTRAFRVGRNWIDGFRRQERANRRAPAVVLARQLYRRDHGTAPPSDEALVGPYLESLPDDGVADAADRPGRRATGAVQ